MDLGRELIAAILREKGTLKKVLDEGFGPDWVNDKQDLSRAAVFGDTDLEAYRFILRHWAEYREVPSRSYFEHTYPPDSFRLPKSDLTTDELLTMVKADVKRVQVEVGGSEFIDLFESGDIDAAVQKMADTAQKVKQDRSSRSVVIPWDSADYDLESKLTRKEKPGIRTGIPELDSKFAGWQPGEMVTYLGTPKAAKTSHLIKAALAAHDDGWNVLLVTVEIKGDSIADRCDCFAAGVENARFIQGHLDEHEKKRLRMAKSNRGQEEYLHIIQPIGKYSVTDLELDVERYRPHVVFLDGFYFLFDPVSGETGKHWKGHDNIAQDLHTMTLRRDITTVVTMQVRGKQATHSKKGELDDAAMMGGTGLLMFSDMVLTMDMDRETWVNTVACTQSRTRYLPTVRGTWYWPKSEFRIVHDMDDTWEEED